MNELIQRMYESDDEDRRDVLHEMTVWVLNCFQDGDIETLNEFFGVLDEKKLSLLFLTAALRNAFAHRAHLPNWESFRIRALEEAKAKHPERFKSVFAGLIDLEWDKTPSPWAGALDRLIGIHPSIARK